MKKLQLKLTGNWKHKSLELWEYGSDMRGSKTTQLWNVGYCLYWLNKPWTWFGWHNNGAKKGVDKCFDMTVHFFVFYFGYTNFDYDKVEAKS